jgi:hypothetical protein
MHFIHTNPMLSQINPMNTQINYIYILLHPNPMMSHVNPMIAQLNSMLFTNESYDTKYMTCE